MGIASHSIDSAYIDRVWLKCIFQFRFRGKMLKSSGNILHEIKEQINQKQITYAFLITF